MAYGDSFGGGAYHSDTYNPRAFPEFVNDENANRRHALRSFAARSSYMLPNGKMVTHVLDPYGGQVRMLIDDIPRGGGMDEGERSFRNQAALMMLQKQLKGGEVRDFV